MGVVVQFDYNSWAARYPEFATVAPTLVELYWNEATIYVRNDGGGPVSSSGIQSTLLNMVTAHICQLNAAVNGQQASQLVGRISDATQGSVHVAAEMDSQPGTAAWFNQTRYGAAAWQAMAPYRTMRYVHGHTRNFRPWFPG